MAELRKLSHLPFALLLCCGQGWATISFVQQCSNAADGSTSYSCTLSNTASGNAIVVRVNGFNPGTISVSDGVNTYSSTSIRCNVNDCVQFFYVLSGAGNSGTLTISVSATGSHVYGNAVEVHTSLSGFAFDGETGTASPGSSSTPTSDSITTTGSNDALFGAMTDFNASSGGCGTSWTTNCGTNTNQSALVCVESYRLNVAAGSYSAPFTLSAAQSDWMAAIMALKETGGGSPPAAINKQHKVDEMEGMIR
jgi:hypothetical protein